MNEPRLPWTRISPNSSQAMAATSGTPAQSSLGAVLIERVQTRVSQINGCAFCLDMHVRGLRVELTWTIATINTWNRMAIGMQAPVIEKAIE